MKETRLKTSLGDIEYQKNNINIKKVFIVAIGSYYKAQFEYYEDAIKFCELAISGGADPSEIKIMISFYEKGEDKDVAEN